MAQIMPIGQTEIGLVPCVVDKCDGAGPQPVTSLPDGKSILSIISSDPSTVTVAMDATPFVDAKIPSVASFTVKAVTPPRHPDKPIDIVLTMINADGSVFATVRGATTVSTTAKGTTGEVFDTPIPVTPGMVAARHLPGAPGGKEAKAAAAPIPPK